MKDTILQQLNRTKCYWSFSKKRIMRVVLTQVFLLKHHFVTPDSNKQVCVSLSKTIYVYGNFHKLINEWFQATIQPLCFIRHNHHQNHHCWHPLYYDLSLSVSLIKTIF